MSDETQTTAVKGPKPFIRRMHVTWWMKSQAFLIFMLRELSCVFIGAYGIVWLVLLYKLTVSKEAYESCLAALRSGPWVVFHFAAFAFAVLHTMTWFKATPQAINVRLGEKRVPAFLLVAANYVVWIAVSAFILWLMAGGGYILLSRGIP